MRALAGIVALTLSLSAVEAVASPSDEIAKNLAAITAAALSGDTPTVASLFPDDMIMVSQSGKVYGGSDARADLGNGFVTWENRDVVVRVTGQSAIVTLINRRQRQGMAPASFRVLQVWKKAGRRWQLAAQSSVKMPD